MLKIQSSKTSKISNTSQIQFILEKRESDKQTNKQTTTLIKQTANKTNTCFKQVR